MLYICALSPEVIRGYYYSQYTEGCMIQRNTLLKPHTIKNKTEKHETKRTALIIDLYFGRL